MTTRRSSLARTAPALVASVGVLVGAWGCESDDRVAGKAEAPAATEAPVPATASSREAAAVAAWEGERVLGVPAYPNAAPATALRGSMRAAWKRAGEDAALFDVKLGERMLVTDDSLSLVREFYLPFVNKVFMDHEMEFPDVGVQEMLTGLIVAPDGTLVKFTATRPFFRYPDRKPIDRTVIQLGRVGRRP